MTERRKIKFRAWSNYHDRILNMNELMVLQASSSNGYSIFNDVNFKIEEFSGKYDNTKWEELTNKERKEWNKETNKETWKGREIYEGDVVQLWEDKIGVVTFEDFYFDFGVCEIETSTCIDGGLKKLGSIHEEELMNTLVKDKYGYYRIKGYEPKSEIERHRNDLIYNLKPSKNREQVLIMKG